MGHSLTLKEAFSEFCLITLFLFTDTRLLAVCLILLFGYLEKNMTQLQQFLNRHQLLLTEIHSDIGHSLVLLSMDYRQILKFYSV